MSSQGTRSPGGSQYSLFGAAALEPTLGDLDGVLLAGGLWLRRGPAARLSAIVDESWRAEALTAEFTLRRVGAGADAVVAAAEGFSVRTAFAEALAPDAARWSRGARVGPPPDLALTAHGLRLWAVTAGHIDEAGYVLGVRDALHPVAGAQLSRLGVAAVALTRRGRLGWRVTGTKRLRRLAELLGPAPAGGERHWPSAATG